jgi:hypothetical protein
MDNKRLFTLYLTIETYSRLKKMSLDMQVPMSSIIIGLINNEPPKPKLWLDTFGDKRGKMTRESALKGWARRRALAGVTGVQL